MIGSIRVLSLLTFDLQQDAYELETMIEKYKFKIIVFLIVLESLPAEALFY